MADKEFVYLIVLVFFTDLVNEKGKPINLKKEVIEFDTELQFESVKEQMASGKRWIVIDYGKNKLPMTINLENKDLAWAQLVMQKVKKESKILTATGEKQMEVIR